MALLLRHVTQASKHIKGLSKVKPNKDIFWNISLCHQTKNKYYHHKTIGENITDVFEHAANNPLLPHFKPTKCTPEKIQRSRQLNGLVGNDLASGLFIPTNPVKCNRAKCPLNIHIIDTLETIKTLDDPKIIEFEKQITESFDKFYKFDGEHNYVITSRLMQSLVPMNERYLENEIGKTRMHVFFPTTRYRKLSPLNAIAHWLTNEQLKLIIGNEYVQMLLKIIWCFIVIWFLIRLVIICVAFIVWMTFLTGP